MTAGGGRGSWRRRARIGGGLAALGLSGAAAFGLRPTAGPVPWMETAPESREPAREDDAPPPPLLRWAEPDGREIRVGWDLFTPPALRWDAGRGEWTDEPLPVEEAETSGAPEGAEAPPQPRIEVVAVGGRFRPIQLVGHVRGADGLSGVFEVGRGRELRVAGPGESWPVLGVRLEAVALAGATGGIDGAGRARAVLRDLATGAVIELVEGVPCLLGEPTAWLRRAGEEEEHALETGGALRTGERTAWIERIEPARRRVYLKIDDGRGGVEHRIERAPVRRGGEDAP